MTPAVHTDEHLPLTEHPMGVGVWNYCTACRDRVCLECGKTDVVTGGGSWMSGHCFGCQGPVIARQDRARRQDELDRQTEAIRSAKAEGWDAGHRIGWEHCQDGNYGTDYWDDDTPNPYRSPNP